MNSFVHTALEKERNCSSDKRKRIKKSSKSHCHDNKVGIRVNFLISSTASVLTHRGNLRIPFLVFIDGYKSSHHQSIGRRNVLLIRTVGNAFGTIRNGDGSLVLLRRSGDGRCVRGSVILARGVGVLQTAAFFECRGALPTMT
jgi:hypothetical protein